MTVPLVLPPVVGGLALLLAFGRNGLVGRYLQAWFGITLPFSTAGVVVAETFVAMPFLVVTVEGALRSADRELEEAAATLGARRLTVFARVTLPLVAPSLLAGAVLCWARALGEFGATITFAGNYPGTTQTMPLAIYNAAADRSGAGDRAEPGAAAGRRGGAGAAARPLAASEPRNGTGAVTSAVPGAGTGAVPGLTDAGLTVAGEVRRGGFRLALDFSVAPGEVLGVLGPNGAGKTTLLRTLAGLGALSRGRIELAGAVLDDPGRQLFVPAERRPVGLVFQNYRLFPHLTVRDNVAFAARAGGAGRLPARRQAMGWLDRLGLAELAGRKPAQLSGGQAQRVALARTLAAEPGLLLLDEPLAALDARTRLEVRAELRRHLGAFGGPSLVVTHDPLEAMVLTDRLLVIEDGRVVQQGTPAEVARRPASQYVARLVGLNLYPGVLGADAAVTLRHGGTDDGGVLHAAGGRLPVPAAGCCWRCGRARSRCTPSGPGTPARVTSGRGRSPGSSCSPTGCGSRSAAARRPWSTSPRTRWPSSTWPPGHRSG